MSPLIFNFSKYHSCSSRDHRHSVASHALKKCARCFHVILCSIHSFTEISEMQRTITSYCEDLLINTWYDSFLTTDSNGLWHQFHVSVLSGIFKIFGIGNTSTSVLICSTLRRVLRHNSRCCPSV